MPTKAQQKRTKDKERYRLSKNVDSSIDARASTSVDADLHETTSNPVSGILFSHHVYNFTASFLNYYACIFPPEFMF